MTIGSRHEAARRVRRLLACALAAVALAAFAPPASALDRGRRLAQYHHQIFLPRGTAATEVTQVAQADDGYLWVGTSVGLYRYDGAAFELMSALGGQSILHLPVTTLFAEPGGGLWIGYSGGAGVGYFKDGRYTAFAPEKGWASMVSGAVDRDGVVWAVVDRVLVRVDHLQRTEIGAGWGLPEVAVHEVATDKAGTVWVSLFGDHDLLYLPRGEKRFRWVGHHIGDGLLTPGHDGLVFVSGPQGLTAVTAKAGEPATVVRISDRAFGRAIVDRDGGFIANSTAGLVHIGDARRLLEPGGEAALLSDVLAPTPSSSRTATAVWSMSEDSEGDVWISSTEGLERFRDSPFTPIAVPNSAFTFSVVAGDGDSVWAGNWDSGLRRIDHRVDVTDIPQVGTRVSSLYRDPLGKVWVATPDVLWRIDEQQHPVPMPVPTQLLQPAFTNMARDGEGRLWLQSSRLVRISLLGGQWTEMARLPGFGEHASTRALMTDSAGRVWLGSGSNIVRVEHDVPTPLTALSAAVHVGAIQAFAERGEHLWIGGLDGVALVRGDHVLGLSTRAGQPFNRVNSVLETVNGDLWVRGADDAWRVSADELRRAIAQDRGEVDTEHFDSLDGLDNMGMRVKSTLAQAGDGTLWFATRQGLAWFDPSRPKLPTPTPTLHVKSVEADGQVLASTTTPAPSLSLPALTHQLQIDYTAIELGYPERILFRYKLEGFDRGWQDAGTRRVAFYNDLPPGDYRFRVSATDRDGRWRDGDDISIALRALPAWYQTPWFKIGVALLVIAVATLAYRLRVRHVAARLRVQLREQLAERDRILNARQAERERIARELHDTLIQSTQGLIYLFQGLAERIAPDEPTRLQLERALARANDVAAEGRDRIEDLRATVKFSSDLPRALAAIGHEILAERGTRFRTIVTGSPREVGPGVIDAVCWIGREVLINASRHAQCEAIEVEILHDDDQLVVSIRDDGIGLPASVLDAATLPGHWGIQGMRERAERIGARFEILGRAGGHLGQGTEVRLSTPASVAYGDMTGRFRWRSFERKSRRARTDA